jgi:hypothetical protein
MRYLCTIYNRDFTAGGPNSVLVGTATVKGRTLREAAARAYVRCVGRKRAQILPKGPKAPRVFAGETNVQAVAVSLRKKSSRFGDCYLLDNMVEDWHIHVEPVAAPSASPRPQPQLRRMRLPHSSLFHFLQRPSSN